MTDKFTISLPGIVLLTAGAFCMVLFCSCQSAPVDPKFSMTPDILRETLIRGETTRDEVFDWLGKPKEQKEIKNHDVWIYEWIEREERTAYSGTKIGEERSFMKSIPGYTHVVTRKTIINIIFSKEGIINNYQITKQ